MGSLLHILIGSVIRAVVPKPWQDRAGQVLFWMVPVTLALLFVWVVVTTEY